MENSGGPVREVTLLDSLARAQQNNEVIYHAFTRLTRILRHLGDFSYEDQREKTNQIQPSSPPPPMGLIFQLATQEANNGDGLSGIHSILNRLESMLAVPEGDPAPRPPQMAGVGQGVGRQSVQSIR